LLSCLTVGSQLVRPAPSSLGAILPLAWLEGSNLSYCVCVCVCVVCVCVRVCFVHVLSVLGLCMCVCVHVCLHACVSALIVCNYWFSVGPRLPASAPSLRPQLKLITLPERVRAC